MKIVYTPGYEARYPTNPVESPLRVSLAAEALKGEGHDFIEPEPASLEDIRRVHGREHIEIVRARGLYDAAALSAGGAIAAAELALEGEPAFGLIRPPGHHASANRAWGMCFFNNMAIAVRRIKKRAGRVLILDIDLHFGDGTVSIFRGEDGVTIINPGSVDANFDYLTLDGSGYISEVEGALSESRYDIIAVSAGFDTYVEDWGKLLAIDDFERIGRAVRDASEERCGGRRFGILEGGYSPGLPGCIRSFLMGFG